jgi:hypothetical protein
LSLTNRQHFEDSRVECKNQDKGCDVKLTPVGKEILDHETTCLERCPLCEEEVPRSVKAEHMTNRNVCFGQQ